MALNKSQRQALISKIKYELAPGMHTFTQCKCGRRGCRGGHCWECLLEDLK